MKKLEFSRFPWLFFSYLDLLWKPLTRLAADLMTRSSDSRPYTWTVCGWAGTQKHLGQVVDLYVTACCSRVLFIQKFISEGFFPTVGFVVSKKQPLFPLGARLQNRPGSLFAEVCSDLDRWQHWQLGIHSHANPNDHRKRFVGIRTCHWWCRWSLRLPLLGWFLFWGWLLRVWSLSFFYCLFFWWREYS